MSEVFLPFKPRRDDEFGHMVVQQNVDALLKELNALTGSGTSLDIITNPQANGAEPGMVLTYRSGQVMWRWPAMLFVERFEKFADTSNIFDFQTMPGGDYRDLLILGQVKGTDAAAQVAWLRFNNDSAGNYDYEYIVGQAGGAAAAQGGAQSGGYGIYVPGSGYDSPATVMIHIPNFNQTVLRKGAMSVDGVADQTSTRTVISQASGWRNTAQISRVQLTLNAGNFKTGSTLALYALSETD